MDSRASEKLEIRLTRPDSSASWGFRLQGGTDFNTPLSVQSVVTDSISGRCGLKAGDAILTINKSTTDAMTHDEAKAEIVRSGNEISMLVERGAVTIWKPDVTPLSDLRPQELKSFTAATGEEIEPVQKTSLAINKPPSEPCRIGSSHNRSPQPFGKTQAHVTHFQYDSPNGLYPHTGITDTTNQHTDGIHTHSDAVDAGSSLSGQSSEQSHSKATSPGFRSVTAPTAKPPSEKVPQSSMICGGCNELATGVIVQANNVPYHVNCFKCAICSVSLKQKGFFVVGGKLVCEAHAQTKPS